MRRGRHRRANCPRTSIARFHTALVPLFALIVHAGGCGGSPGTTLQSYDPPTAAAKALELYDGNNDGKLSAEELKKSPALTASLRRLDGNRDSALSADEIRARFEELDRWAKFVAVDATFTHRGRPLVGAQVSMTPEPFMGEGYPTYSGTTVEGGIGVLLSEGREYPATPSGFYTIRIVHAESGIDETRGVEIADDATGSRLAVALP